MVWNLTRKAQIDCSLATRTMAFDIHNLSWSKEVFEVAGIDVSLMSEPVPMGTSAGTITLAAAQRTGLNKGCVIVSVSHDQVATPYMDTGSKGAVLGLTTATTAADIYRACMEGVVYEMRLNYEALSGSGIHFEKLNATGGGARSKRWMQMKTDVLNLPITALKTVGSAMLTGIAVGLFTDLKDAAAHMVQEMGPHYPRAEIHEKYMKNYERYKSVYNAVRPLM